MPVPLRQSNAALLTTQANLEKTVADQQATNATLGEFRQQSLDLVFNFARVMNEAQDSTVVGFAETELRLWELIKPFQGYTLAQGAYLLAPADVMMARYVYGRAIDRFGEVATPPGWVGAVWWSWSELRHRGGWPAAPMFKPCGIEMWTC